MFLISMV